jgi:hypothetical protein
MGMKSQLRLHVQVVERPNRLSVGIGEDSPEKMGTSWLKELWQPFSRSCREYDAYFQMHRVPQLGSVLSMLEMQEIHRRHLCRICRDGGHAKRLSLKYCP